MSCANVVLLQLYFPRGLRVLADGTGLVVTDMLNHRLCLFRLSGEFVTAMGSKDSICWPVDVLECWADGSFIAANRSSQNLSLVSRVGTLSGLYPELGTADRGVFDGPCSLAVLRNGGMAVMDKGHCHTFVGLTIRYDWIVQCVVASTRL